MLECRRADERLINAFGAGKYSDTAPGDAYHNFWWLSKPPDGVIMALGVGGQVLYVDSENDFVAAKFSSQPQYEDPKMEFDELSGMKAIAANPSMPITPLATRMNGEILSRFFTD